MAITIHLCQPDAHTACGTCCGMYNVAGATREQIESLLRHRTAGFEASCDVADGSSLDAFCEAGCAAEAPDKLLGLLRNCPFLGVLDPRSGRVGCLVHPEVTEGADGREHGVYDLATCRDYLCAAYTVLSVEERRFVIAACTGDSYLYGLVLNDVALIRGLFEGVAEVTGGYPRGRRLFVAEVVAAARAFFELKVDWEWADPEAGIIGAYLPNGESDVMRRVIDYEAIGALESRFDTILRSLGSTFDELEGLREAEAVIYKHIFDVAEAFEAAG